MDKRYIAAITNNPQAGVDMICILIIDTKSGNRNSEVFNIVVHKSEKALQLRPFLEKLEEDLHVIDLSN